MSITTRCSPYWNVPRWIGRRPGIDDLVEQTPPRQLEHTRPHQGMRGERVAPERGALEQERPQSAFGEQHRRGGAGGATTDDDHVVRGAAAEGWR